MNSKEKIVSPAYVRNSTILSLVIFILFIGGCIAAWKWLHKQPKEAGALAPLRKVLNANEFIFGNIYSSTNLSKTFPVKEAEPRVRVNGDVGLSKNFDTSAWRLQVIKSPGDTLLLTLNDIKKLPKTELIFNFKCIEGWSQVTHWAGVRFSDFVKHYGLEQQSQMQFTALITPDKKYYVGIDNRSMLHDQTILCYQMNGNALPLNQGYPLRLIIPVKYGVKHLKRIGAISFSNQRPRDYWYERGYDYYCGL